jgi:hypothetical protein
MTQVAYREWFQWLTAGEVQEAEDLHDRIQEQELDLRELKRQREVLSRRAYNRRYVARGKAVGV